MANTQRPRLTSRPGPRSLCGRIGALDALRTHLKAYIRRVAGAIVADEDKEAELIPSLLAMKARMDGFLQRCFGRNEGFAAAVREGFEHCLNQVGAGGHGVAWGWGVASMSVRSSWWAISGLCHWGLVFSAGSHLPPTRRPACLLLCSAPTSPQSFLPNTSMA